MPIALNVERHCEQGDCIIYESLAALDTFRAALASVFIRGFRLESGLLWKSSTATETNLECIANMPVCVSVQYGRLQVVTHSVRRTHGFR